MKRTGFKFKQRKPLKRTPFKRKVFVNANANTDDVVYFQTKPSNKVKMPLKRSKLRVVGKSSTTELRNEIQAVLREIVMIRDGGCILRHYPHEITSQYQDCGGYRKDGQLILQAEHLHTRSNAASFADTRLVICLCQRHHGYYKPQFTEEYYAIVRKHIGKERSDLLDRVKDDHHPHKVDLKLSLVGLKQELANLKKSHGIENNQEKINY